MKDEGRGARGEGRLTEDDYQSWGRYPPARARRVLRVERRDAVPDIAALEGTVLAYGCGRSYGDSCLNDGGVLLDTRGLERLIELDELRGVLRCEAGMTLAAILRLIVPRGWFLPVLPGTKWVTIGGAIASDIHGKNHHVAGTFGRHVTRFELLRSCGDRLECSPEQNTELFRATIGGLGLTGLILWAEIRLQRVSSPAILAERIRFRTLEEFFALSREADRVSEHTVAWVDCLARGKELGRGILFTGRPGAEGRGERGEGRGETLMRIPFDLPSGLLNPVTVGAFNGLYYRWPPSARSRRVVGYDPFFFPLDAIGDWNRMYGRRGFLQYQCVVPDQGESHGPIATILRRVSASREASFLAVLKKFGDISSPGLLSFPRPGVTLALDVPFRGQRTLALLEELDSIVRPAGGAVYPAKDARMSAESFRSYYPEWRRFKESVDEKFSSGFWRRVGGEKGRGERGEGRGL